MSRCLNYKKDDLDNGCRSNAVNSMGLCRDCTYYYAFKLEKKVEALYTDNAKLRQRAALWKRCAKQNRTWYKNYKQLFYAIQEDSEVDAESALATREAQLVEMCGHILRMFDLDDIHYMKAKARAILKELER